MGIHVQCLQRLPVGVHVLWKIAYYGKIKIISEFLFHTDFDNHSHKYGLLQYLFEGPEVDIKVKPHGNSKKATPFFPNCQENKGTYSRTCIIFNSNESGTKGHR